MFKFWGEMIVYQKVRLIRHRVLAFVFSSLLTFTSGVSANPTGEELIAGQAGFNRAGNNLTVNQLTDRVIINWQDFSIAQGELTKFVQLNNTSAALNRVVSGSLSSLLGDLQASGQVYLINPNGMVIGADANINTQSFIVSTLDVDNDQFMQGGDLHFVGDSEQSIEHLGTIKADGGDVFLIAKHVDNQGTINADGHVGLAGGTDVLLKASGDDRLAVRVTDKDGRVDQKGLVEATKIELLTAGNNPYALAINHEGVTRATSAVNKQGRIILFAEGGTTKADGTLDASAPESGNGGFIETSGTHVKIADTVNIDTSAANGETGEWLIDPNDFTIAATGGDITATNLAIQLNSNNVTIETATQGSAGGNGDIFVNEDTTWISNNSLTLNAERNIEVNNAITNTGTGDLNLNALDGSITTGSATITLGGGAVTFTTTEAATNNTAGDRNIQIGSGGINAANTNITLNSADDVIINGVINSASLTATAGDGKDGVGTLPSGGGPKGPLSGGSTGNAGERGGNITVTSTGAVTTQAGDLTLIAGRGGNGATGGNGTFVEDVDGDANNSGGTGGEGGAGGTIVIDGTLTSNQDLSITAGSGGHGGQAGNGSFPGGDSSINGDGGNSGGSGGSGGAGGNITINAALDAVQDIQLMAGQGGAGGSGGDGNSIGGSGSFLLGTGGNSGGTGGTGGAGGSIIIDVGLDAGRDINLMAGHGGAGGIGGIGLGNGADFTNGGSDTTGNSGGTGGAGGDAGNITINAALDAARNIQLTAGQGGAGGLGGSGFGNGGRDIATSRRGGNSGGTAGAAGAGGDVTINAALDAEGNIQLIAGQGGAGGAGGQGNGDAGSGAHGGNSGGTGGAGGAGGNIAINAALDAEGNMQLVAGQGGAGGAGGQGDGDGGVGSGSGVGGAVDVFGNPEGGDSGGTGGAGGAGGNIAINAALNAVGNIQLTVGQGDAGGAGGIGNGHGGGGSGNVNGTGGVGGIDGEINGSNIDVTANSGSITVTGAINAGSNDVLLNAGDQLTISDLITANNISLTAAGTNAAIGSNVSAIQTNASGIITANASNGTGGIFLGNQGDFNLNGATINAGTGDIALTALDGSLTTGTTALNVSGANVTLTTTEDAGNNTAGDRNIQIGSGGINAANTNVTLTSADDVIIDGAINGSNIDVTANSGSITVTGAINPDAGGSVSLLAGTATGQLLTFITPQNFNLTGTGSLSLQGFGFGSANNYSTVDGDISINSGDGALDLMGTVTATNGDVTLTSVGTLTASQLITGNNINLTASGSHSSIGSLAAGAIQVHASGNITANATNGVGGIFLSSQGNFNLNGATINSGFGRAELTAVDGTLTTGSGVISFSGDKLILATTEDGGNMNPDDRNIIIGSSGFNVPGATVIFDSADNVELNGALVLDLSSSVIKGDTLIANTVNGIGSAGAALRTEVANAALSNTGSGGIYVINTGDVTVAANSNNGDVSIETAIGRFGGPAIFGFEGPGGNGGNITVGSVGALSGITTTGVGDVSLRTGRGGAGAGGGNGGALILDAALNVSGAVTLTSGDGGLSSFLENPTVTRVGFVGGTGGALTLNAALNASGAATLTSGDGGHGGGGGGNCAGIACPGGSGGSGGALTLNAALNASGAVTLTSGDGGTGGLGGTPVPEIHITTRSGSVGGSGGSGGALTLNAALNAPGAVTLTSGTGGTGGLGGTASPVGNGLIFDIFSHGGTGGHGGMGGALTLNAALNASGAATLTSGDGGTGGDGGLGYNGGLGRTGGSGGVITLNAALSAQQDISLSTGTAGSGGNGGAGGNGNNGSVGSPGPDGADGADGQVAGSQIDLSALNGSLAIMGLITPDAGSSVSLLAGTAAGQLLTLNTPQDFNLTGTGSLSLQGFGFSSANNYSTVDGDISINSGDGALDLSGTVTATNGDVTLSSSGNLSASQILTANNINLTATGTNAAIGSSGAAIQTNASGIINASAANGTGGIFLIKQGDFNLNGATINSGTGDAELTAVDGNLTTGVSTFNFNGANLSLIASDTTAADNNTPVGITIGTAGINANGGNVTLKAADDVLLNGQINAGSGNVIITADDDSLDTFADTDGSILDVAGLDNNVDIIANELTLNASEQIGGRVVDFNMPITLDNALNLQVTKLTANAPNNHISVTEVDDINLGNIISEATNGATVITAGGNIEYSSGLINARQLFLTTTGLNSSIGGAGQLFLQNNAGIFALIDASNGSGDVNVNIQGDLSGSSNINAGTGNVDIDIRGDIGQSSPGANITAATLDVFAESFSSSDGDVYLETNIDRLIARADGLLEVNEADDIDLGNISLSSDEFRLNSFAGSITQTTGILNARTFISAQSLNASIGSEASPLRVTTDRIVIVANNGNGGIYIDGQGVPFITTQLYLDAGIGDVLYQNSAGFQNASATDRIIGNNVTLANINAAVDTSNFTDFNVGTLNLNNIGGDVSINETDGLALGTIDVGANNFTLSSGGSISSNSSTVTANNLSLTTTGSDAAIGAAGDSINTTLSGNLTANATNGTGGVYVSDSGSLNIANVNAGSGDVVLQAATDLVLEAGSEVKTSGAGNIVLAAGNDFHNDSGGSAPLNLGTGRFVVYSERPDDNRNDIAGDANAIAHDFVQYNTIFNPNDPILASLPMNNGFVYSVQPVLTGVAVMVNNQTIDYGETISSILNTNFTVTGGVSASYEVGGMAINAADFELADPGTVTINGSDVELSLANTVAISNAGFAATGSYTDGIEAGVIAGSALASQGIALSGSGDLIVNKINLDVTVAADNKVYDATDAAVLSLGADNRLSGDVLSIDAGTSTFDDKNVGVGKTVTVAGATLSGADAGNYNLNITNSGTLTADITQADLIVNGATAQDKVYDQTTTVTIMGAGITALLSDTVILNLDSANFGNKNAGTNKVVTANYSISGADAANYNLIQPTSLTADITRRILNATLTADDKTYDTSIAATGTFGDDRIAGDVLIISGTSNFITKDAGANKTVTATGLTLSGNDAANYVLASTSVNDLADINRANLTVSGVTAQDKVYDATTTATVTGGGITALSGDVVTLVVGAANFADKNVGSNKIVNTNFILSGADANNYNVVQPTSLTANITAADLIITGAVAQNKVYDATTTAVVTGATVNVLGSDVVTLGAANANFNNKNAGAGKAVTTNFGLTGADASNYNLIQPGSLTADITGRTLNAVFAADDKVYDALTTARGSFIDDRVVGDVLTINDGGLNFTDKNVGTGKTVNAVGLSLSGTDAANYILASTTANDTADITQAPLTVSANDFTRNYDGTAFTDGNGVDFTGFVGGESQADLSGALTFTGNSQGATNVGSYIITPGGLSSSNYAISFVDAELTINSVPLSVTANDFTKVFDGDAFNGGNGVMFDGFVGSDDESDLPGSLDFGGSSQGAVNPGEFTITPLGLTSNNYDIAFIDGTLTIDVLTSNGNGSSGGSGSGGSSGNGGGNIVDEFENFQAQNNANTGNNKGPSGNSGNNGSSGSNNFFFGFGGANLPGGIGSSSPFSLRVQLGGGGLPPSLSSASSYDDEEEE